MKNFNVSSIGEIETSEDGFKIKIKKEYHDGLTGLAGFSHIDVVWLAHNAIGMNYPDGNVIRKPYTNGPDKIGVFATRSQIRPNPVAITAVSVLNVDPENGIIYIPYIDADPGTPVLDIKPYLPSTNIFCNVSVPEWCSHWPESIEESANFDWSREFTFE